MYDYSFGLKPEYLKLIIDVISKNDKIKKAIIYGSRAKGNYTEGSDIDILVDVPKNIDLFDFIKMKNEIEDILHKKVDLVEYSTLKPVIKEVILKEQIIIYE